MQEVAYWQNQRGIHRFIDSWKETELLDIETGRVTVEDNSDGKDTKEEMEGLEGIGDIIANDGRI
jgi:hypothetical protein